MNFKNGLIVTSATITIYDKEYIFNDVLIDTGANTSCISSKYVKIDTSHPDYLGTKLCNGVNSTTDVHNIKSTILVCGIVFTIPILVCDITNDAIIGMDILKNSNLVLEYKGNNQTKISLDFNILKAELMQKG